ncbi:hypothetical protein [Streptomyces sp. NPDC057579]|uniref:hypothetical protein n=1 Tax=Streptomyces sp. NPDC057579 TaxID=3346172 RepID=UPI00368062FB
MTHPVISRRPRTPGRSARSRRLLTGAVALTLAVTAGPLVAPAVAATPAAAGATAAPAQQLKIAPGSEILSAGRTGFLSVAADEIVSWTRYADGETTELARDDGTFTDSTMHGTASDVVVLGDAPYLPSSKKITLRDMATGSSTVIDLTPYGYSYAGAVGTSVIALKDTGKTREAHILENVGGKVTDRAVTGLRFPARDMAAVAGEPGAVVLRYEPDDVIGSLFSEYIVVDLASAKVTHHTLGADFSRVALSGTHVAVMGHENNNRDDMKLEVEKRGDNQQRTTHSPGRMYDPMVGLVGNWVLYGTKRKVHEGWANFPQGLYAMPADGYAAHKVMDHATSVTPTPDGDLLVMGGTTEHGEGLYRVSVGAFAEPVAKLIAGTGEPTKVTVLDSEVPAVAEMDKGRWKARWRLSRPNVEEVAVTLRHTASGVEREVEIPIDSEVSTSGKPTWIELDWDGLLGPLLRPRPGRPQRRLHLAADRQAHQRRRPGPERERHLQGRAQARPARLHRQRLAGPAHQERRRPDAHRHLPRPGERAAEDPRRGEGRLGLGHLQPGHGRRQRRRRGPRRRGRAGPGRGAVAVPRQGGRHLRRPGADRRGLGRLLPDGRRR